MDHSPTSVPDSPLSSQGTGLRMDWLRASISSGFIATFSLTICMAIAYGIANALADDKGNTLQRWFDSLTSNELTENVGDSFAWMMILNLAMGLVWAMVYAKIFAPMLSGPGWRRGMVFSLIPWALSILVFFPIAGVGFFGSEIKAGILPVLGNLILHLVYGAILGTLYGTQVGENVAGEGLPLHVSSQDELAAAIGIIAGGVVGFIGGWVVGPSMSDLASRPVVAFGGALSGAAMGMLLGALLGMKIDDEPS